LYTVRTPTGEFVVVDGVAGERFKRVGYPAFSPDSRHVVYTGTRGQKQVVVRDGKPGAEYDGVGMNGIRAVFSPDGTRMAYTAGRGEKRLVVTDGREGPAYDGVPAHALVFSPDSRRVAYIAGQVKKGTCVVLDGVEQKWYPGISGYAPPVFSPDGKHVAYVASSGRNKVLVRDGKEGNKHTRVADRPVFSPDSKRLAYVALVRGLLSDAEAVFVDGVKQEATSEGIQSLKFSPDGKRLAWIASRSVAFITPFGGLDTGSVKAAVVDGVKGKGYDQVRTLTFSSDSRRFAYVGVKGHDYVFVVDGTVMTGAGESAGAFHFSPDGRHVAYPMSARPSPGKPQRAFLVVNNDARYEVLCLRMLFTAPDRLRVLGWRAKERRVVHLRVEIEAL
ncbi:PD40 domain-containing protein, partial [bacterium]|nr:PD40 domain-containing protein [bacterium]